MNQASQLNQLQTLDTEIDRINHRLAEIDRTLSSDEIVQAAEASELQAKNECTKARRNLQTIETSVDEVRIKISTSDAALYGGKIRNPKELQDLQTEISSLKKRMSALEDEQLEAMVLLEQAETALSIAARCLEATRADQISQHAGLLGEQSQLQKELERLLTVRSATYGSILPENASLYERLRKQKRGVAVSKIEDGACKACGSSVRPAERQMARIASQLVLCSDCGRILYSD